MCKGSRNSTAQQTSAVHEPAVKEPQGRIQDRRVLDLQVGSLLAQLEMKDIPPGGRLKLPQLPSQLDPNTFFGIQFPPSLVSFWLQDLAEN